MSIIRSRQRSVTAISPHNGNRAFLVPIRRGPQLLLDSYPFTAATIAGPAWVPINGPVMTLLAEGVLQMLNEPTGTLVSAITQQLTGLVPGARYLTQVHNPHPTRLTRFRVGPTSGSSTISNTLIQPLTTGQAVWTAPANGEVWVSMANAYGTANALCWYMAAQTRLAGGGHNVDYPAVPAQLLLDSAPWVPETITAANWVKAATPILSLLGNGTLRMENGAAAAARIEQTVPLVNGASYRISSEGEPLPGATSYVIRVGLAAGGFEMGQFTVQPGRFQADTFIAIAASAVIAYRVAGSSLAGAFVGCRNVRLVKLPGAAPPPVVNPQLLLDSAPFSAATLSGVNWIQNNSPAMSIINVAELRIENTLAATSFIYQQVAVEIGATYEFKARVPATAPNSMQYRVGTASNDGDYLQSNISVGNSDTAPFVATTATAFVTLRNTGGVIGGRAEVTDVELRKL